MAVSRSYCLEAQWEQAALLASATENSLYLVSIPTINKNYRANFLAPLESYIFS